VQRLELFGSAVEGCELPDSDLDFLVDFGNGPTSGYADAYFGLLEALEELFKRPVDLVVASAIRNPISSNRCAFPRRSSMLSFAKTGTASCRSLSRTSRELIAAMIALPGRPGVPTAMRSVARQLHVDVHGAADDVTSGGVSFVTVIYAADLPDCDSLPKSPLMLMSRIIPQICGVPTSATWFPPDQRTTTRREGQEWRRPGTTVVLVGHAEVGVSTMTRSRQSCERVSSCQTARASAAPFLAELTLRVGRVLAKDRCSILFHLLVPGGK
jgi:predicted nucleotidyltransferase